MKRVLLSVFILPLLYSVVYAEPPSFGPVDVLVINGETTPVPVDVQKNSHNFLRGQVDLVTKGENDLDSRTVGWQSPYGNNFSDIPEGYALFVTDIIVSSFTFLDPIPDAPFALVFVHKTDGGASRLLDIAGTGLPYSHSFTTPISFATLNEEGGELGINRITDDRLFVNLTGYLELIVE